MSAAERIEILASQVYRRCEDAVTRSIGGETFLVPIKGDLVNMELMFVLDEVGTSIWSLIDGHRSVAEIVDALLIEYEVDRRELERDVAEFLGRLTEPKLIEVVR